MDSTILDVNERVSGYLNRLIAQEQIPGIQYVVVDVNDNYKANKVRMNYAGGVLDTATQEKVTESTSFLSSSCAKVLTAVAILKLIQASKVDLEDPLSTYFDKHPYGNKLRIRHLLNQSSGIPNPMPLRWFHTEQEHGSYSEAEALEAVLQANPKLDFAPGEKYAYSNISYWLLGKVIEQASGVDYCEYMRKEIFAPLGISRRELDCEIQDKKEQARGHQKRYTFMTFVFWMLTESKIWDTSANGWARFQHLYMNGPSYGGVSGTALGYAKFLQDMLADRSALLTPESKALLFEDHVDASGKLMPTTLGWHRGKNGQHMYYGKPGGGPGYNSNIRVYPEAGIATVYLSNKTEVSEGPINAFSDTLDMELLRCQDS